MINFRTFCLSFLLSALFVISAKYSGFSQQDLPPEGSKTTIVSDSNPAAIDSNITNTPQKLKPSNIPVAIAVDRIISRHVLGKTLRQPSGVAVDRAGGLFLVDAGNQRVVHFDRELTPVSEIGGSGRNPGDFDRPGFVTIDNNLNIFVADGGNQRVDRYDSRLNFVNSIQFVDDNDPLKYGEPSGLAVTDYGELWLADRTNNRLVVFDNAGRMDRFVGDFGYAGGQLDSPEKVVKEREGAFIVCDGGNSRLMVYDDYGNFSHEITNSEFAYPVSLAISKDGYWVLDNETGIIFYLSREGEIQLMTGPLLPGSQEPLRDPSDIALLPDGRLVIADSGNNRVVILSVFSEQ